MCILISLKLFMFDSAERFLEWVKRPFLNICSKTGKHYSIASASRTMDAWCEFNFSGPNCSKLTMSLVNDSLKF